MASEDTNKILIEVMQKALNGIDAAVSFGQAQLPDVIQQLMHWKMASYSVRIFIMSLFLIGSVLLFRKACAWNDEIHAETMGFFCLMGSGALGLIMLFGILVNIGNLIELWMAPKIWLIEYTAELIKASN